MTERERQFADAARVIDESVVMRIVKRPFVERPFVERPFQGRGLFTGRGLQTARLTAALKGPLYVLAAGSACITHIVLLQWMPDRIAPVKPLAYGMVLAFGAFAAVAGFITTRNNATATADSSAGTAKTRKS